LKVNSVVAEIFSGISFSPLNLKGNKGISMITGLHPWCPLPPYPNPPPRRGGAVKNLKYAPLPFPLPLGERVNILKYERNSLPLDGGGEGGGDVLNVFFAMFR
jgi:hypothetical protein